MESTQSMAKLVGCFRRGRQSLALPIDNLQEVVPLTTLHEIPSRCEGVIGAMMLRGKSVAVLDLCPIDSANDADPAPAGQCVVIVRDGAFAIGILADALIGLFSANERNLTPCQHTGLIMANLALPELDCLVSLINLQKLTQLPNLPLTEISEVDFQSKLGSKDLGHGHGQRKLMMLMRNGDLDLAIDPTEIETTLAKPEVIPQELSGGFFAGVIHYRGKQIPAIKLSQLEAGRNSHAKPTYQAFVLRTHLGAVAYLIDAILEIIQVAYDQMTAIPAMPFGGFQYYQAVIANDLLDAGLLAKIKPQTQQHLVINTGALKTHQGILDLITTYAQTTSRVTGGDKGKASTAELKKSHAAQQLITYELGELHASRLDQIQEVLPYSNNILLSTASSEDSSGLLGLLTNRSRSIPVMDLQLLIRGRKSTLDSKSSVLIVNLDDQLLGFAIERLHSIEKATWSPTVPKIALGERPAYRRDLLMHKMAEIDLGSGKAILDVIDLHDVMQVCYLSHSERNQPAEGLTAPTHMTDATTDTTLTGIAQTSGDTVDAEVYAT